MRAMILAAGLGQRLRPLSDRCAKPALPVLGRPVIAWLLELLAHHGITEVAINLHHLPESIEAAVRRFRPPGMHILYSREPRPLGTGGGIASMKEFLSESDPALVLAGDMLLDLDLSRLARQHLDSGAACTLLLRGDDERAARFGSIGIDDRQRVRRISKRFDLGGERRSGLFVGVRIISPTIFESLPTSPPETPFEDLTDWFAPALAAGAEHIRGQIEEKGDLIWEPVGTPAEYLAVNMSPPSPSYLGKDRLLAPGTRRLGGNLDVVLGRGASLGEGANLRRAVIWEDEVVPANFRASGGVFANGTFYFSGEPDQPGEDGA